MSGSSKGLVVRPAKVTDTKAILNLVNKLAVQQIMLPRSPASVVENIRDFTVAEVDGAFAGCGALHIVWTDMAEVRSLAVDPDVQRGGIGRVLVDRLVAEAGELGIPRLFAFTYVPGFFQKMGFAQVAHEELPHKVFNDCMHCPKFQACDEIAMERVLDPAASPERLFGRQARAIPTPERLEPVGTGLPSRPIQAQDPEATRPEV